MTSLTRFDADHVRTWLTQPTDTDTIAQQLGIGDDFDIYGFHRWQRITNLVTAAQAADLFGPPGHVVEILHLAGEHGFVDRHRITLTTAQPGLMWCSPDIDSVDLLTDHLTGVDAAVHLLGAAAEITDTLLHQAETVRPARNTPRVGQAFPPLTRITPTAARTPTGPAASPPGADKRGRNPA
jgi:hypothetical protein